MLGRVLAAVLPLALRFWSLRRVLWLCDRIPPLPPGVPAPPVERLARQARRLLAHGHGPWTDTCLSRSVLLYALLRRHRYEPHLHIGAAGRANCFTAHAWLTVDGNSVLEPAPQTDGYRDLLVHHV